MTSKFCFAKGVFSDYHGVIEQIAQALNVAESSFAVIENCKDIWVRDFMPYQRHDGKYVQYCYSPDYLQNDKDIQYQTNPNDVRLMDCSLNETFQENLIKTNLILDGGNIIKCLDADYKPCVIMTEKVLYENKDKSYCEVVNELREIFDAEIILIPWDTEEPYGHADGMIRCISPGKLLINNYIDIDVMLYIQLTRMLGKRFEIHQLEYGKSNRKNSWCHINYLETDTDVLIPACGIPSDELAKSQIEQVTGKKCHLIKMSNIIRKGGALHCISWEL